MWSKKTETSNKKEKPNPTEIFPQGSNQWLWLWSHQLEKKETYTFCVPYTRENENKGNSQTHVHLDIWKFFDLASNQVLAISSKLKSHWETAIAIRTFIVAWTRRKEEKKDCEYVWGTWDLTWKLNELFSFFLTLWVWGMAEIVISKRLEHCITEIIN